MSSQFELYKGLEAGLEKREMRVKILLQEGQEAL